MIFSGRSRELGRLRYLLDQPTPQLVRVVGPSGAGKSALVRRAIDDFPHAWYSCPPLPDPAQRAGLAAVLRSVAPDTLPDGGPDDPDWRTLLSTARGLAEGRPLVLVLDDAHHLTEARARFVDPLRATLQGTAADAAPLHLVLIGRAAGLPANRIEEIAVSTIAVGPLPLRAAAPHLPGNEPDARIRAYGVFGGLPRVLSMLDTSVTVGTNVRRLLLDDAGALADAPVAWLEREVQTPSRYVAILRALASGEADWSTVHAGVPDLTRSGQVAPYLKRLADIGLVETRTPLDAGPRSRTTRYALTDPFLAFWFRCIFSWRYPPRPRARDVSIREHYARDIRPAIDGHMETVMPAIARQHIRYDALETLGATAREEGSLWGADVEVPIAGILTSGAVYYGLCSWRPPAREASPLERLDAQVRQTRYGFGRERRLRLIFTGRPAPTWLRRDVARRADAMLIDAEELLGVEGPGE